MPISLSAPSLSAQIQGMVWRVSKLSSSLFGPSNRLYISSDPRRNSRTATIDHGKLVVVGEPSFLVLSRIWVLRIMLRWANLGWRVDWQMKDPMEGGCLWIGNGLRNFNMEHDELECPKDCDKAYQCIRLGRLQSNGRAFIDTFTRGRSTSLTMHSRESYLLLYKLF